ncbi:glycosyltransferase [Ktedonosporobacter rubrisoli]|uniref:Glycosyltransferase n=1 Tax=Ktedonosporobacter rubrisoli TaxID=2509675 RepID=A0A4P6K5I0_KTERU|nr:glycosyltransferase family 4 protein [Ktedonosporobacter rubrisoli]QBD83252.1 glycosyltransferase [Ktedonosporobacter rubrisoli]
MLQKDRPLKIAFLTEFALQEIKTWSWAGTYYHIAQAMQKYCGEITYISPVRGNEQVIARLVHRASRLLLRKRYAYHNCVLVARQHAKRLGERLARQHFDLIVSPAGETEIAFLQTEIPIVLVEDATYGLLIDYHQEYINLVEQSIRELHLLEKMALTKASAVIASSPWAAHSIIEDYAIDKQKVHVLPFGANFTYPPEAAMVQERQRSSRCKLLFIGANWEHKGGSIAFETLLHLEEMGIEAELIVCGCRPPGGLSHKHMRVIPFLDKNDRKQNEELKGLYLSSDFLILPTRNDCTPIVCCEAAAFGLPVIIADTGGVSGVVIDGENGCILPYTARGDKYAAIIASLYRDQARYAQLVRSSRAMFETKLNWDAWGVAAKKIVMQLLDGY